MDEKYYQILLEFIAKFGVVHEKHIACVLPQLDKASYKSMLKNDYLVEHRLHITTGAYYTLGSRGAQLMTTKEIKALNLNTLNHDMLLLDLYFDLQEKNPEANIQSERELKIGLGIKVGDKKKFPDLLLTNVVAEKIAIELEISEKSQARLIEIINNYIADTTLSAIHYFVKFNALGKKLLELAGYHHKLRVFLLDKDSSTLSYTEIIRVEEAPVATSPWSFDLDEYLNNPDKYRK